MFGTVILDTYKKSDKLLIAKALDELCSPKDSYGWGSAGIYCFWDYYNEEILYIGLASDLTERFKQHNGLSRVNDDSCKYKYIEKYFENNDRLGYSIFAQSPLSQPLTHKNKKKYSKIAEDINSPVEDMISDQGKVDIKLVEGLLIESYRIKHGHFPPWNDIGGSVEGQRRVMANNYNIVKSFCSPQDYEVNPIMSKSTLRELAENPSYSSFESFLHVVRMNMLIHGLDYQSALNLAMKFDNFGWYEKIIEAGYDKKKLFLDY
jgi:GIY-YIG catalytic domain.